MLELLFSPLVISCILVAGSAAFGVSVVSGFIKDRSTLEAKRRQVDKILKKLRAEISERGSKIQQLEEEIAQLQPVHDRLNTYFEGLNQLKLDAERKAMAEEEKHTPHDDDEDDAFGRERHRVSR
ncbi:MAG: hypothetical protein HN712_11135 [Gemmatimonadetes bacterium]|nr:hypothetical protein [Gemmatimonadota bacterium]MBT6146859.1 hypothetical protein [Gemmatimonadota bacterium]MBT7860860.1 hypothetical protein [Gemmatimonadota bacterium]